MVDEKVIRALGVLPKDFRTARKHPRVKELYRDAKKGDVSASDLEGAVKLVIMGEGDAVTACY